MIANEIKNARINKAKMGIRKTISDFLSKNDLDYIKAKKILSNIDCENCKHYKAHNESYKYCIQPQLQESCNKWYNILNDYLEKKQLSYLKIANRVIRNRKKLVELKVIINKIILKQYEQTSKH